MSRDADLLSEVMERTVARHLDIAPLLRYSTREAFARLALGTRTSPRRMMQTLAELHATLVRVQTKGRGRRPTVMLAPDLSAEQRRAAKRFDLERWMPSLDFHGKESP